MDELDRPRARGNDHRPFSSLIIYAPPRRRRHSPKVRGLSSWITQMEASGYRSVTTTAARSQDLLRRSSKITA